MGKNGSTIRTCKFVSDCDIINKNTAPVTFAYFECRKAARLDHLDGQKPFNGGGACTAAENALRM